MSNYSNRTADSFRDASTLRTGFDGLSSNVARAHSRYLDGLRVGNGSREVTVAINDVWGASCNDGSHLSSCERLGYHANTSEFWRGILDSGCAIVVYRINPDGSIGRHNLRAALAELAAA